MAFRHSLFTLLSLFFIGQSFGQSKLDSLESILDNTTGIEKVDILNKLGFEYAFSSLIKAKKYAYLGLNESKKIGYEQGQARALINVGYSNLDYKQLDSAIYYFSLASDFSKNIKDTTSHANALNGLGNLYLNRGDYSLAITNYNDALFYQTKIGNKRGQSAALNNIGKILENVGSYDKAIEYFMAALKINKENNFDRNSALNLLNISMAYISQDDYENPTTYLEEAEAMPITNENQSLKANLLNQKGLVAKNKTNYDSAIYFYQQVIQIDNSIGASIATPLHNMADAYLAKKEYSSAYSIAKQALELKMKEKNRSSIIFSMNLLADIYLRLENYDEALKISKEALTMAIEVKHKDRERQSLKYISESYYGKGEFKTAWEYRLKYEHLEDSLFNTRKSEQMAIMSSLYETNKKQQTIELQEADLKVHQANLNIAQSSNSKLWLGIVAAAIASLSLLMAFVIKFRSNKKLSKQKELIEAKNIENETLLKEIHHRVKNNLQIISSILNIQSRNLESQSAREAVNEGRSRIKSMSLIHEKLYGNNQLSFINMKEYIEELNAFLFKSYSPKSEVIQHIEVDAINLDIDTAVPVGLILNELISNALKYAYNDNGQGELNISLFTENENHVLRVQDNGPGLPDDYKETKSMGMRLVNALTEQLNGILEVDSSEGTSFVLKFACQVKTN